MHQLKRISKESIPTAIEKAERYRLINEPGLAESICLDILEVDPHNAKATIVLLLAITDQFATGASGEVNRARQLLPKLQGEYEKNYYAGIICERQALANLNRRSLGHSNAYDWFIEAMEFFEKAESMRPQGNDSAIMRWNTCVRQIKQHQLTPSDEKYVEPPLE